VSGPRTGGLADGDPGPFVRPYAITKGRTTPGSGNYIGLIDTVVAARHSTSPRMTLGPEHRELLARCQRAAVVVDLAAEVDLPTGVVRVLLGDLWENGLVSIYSAPQGSVTNQRLLQEVLDGLKSL
jgi:hypothetical protein